MSIVCFFFLVYIHTKLNPYRLCSQRERNNITVQSHLQVHRWCIVHKQPKNQKLFGSDVSCRTWDQRYYREYHFCFLPRITTELLAEYSTCWRRPVSGRRRRRLQPIGGTVNFTLPFTTNDDFNFHITHFPFLSGNISSSPAYGVFISQLIRYAWACSSYGCFILRARRLTSTSKLLNQGYLMDAWNRHSRSFMVDTGILFSNMKSLYEYEIKWLSDTWPVTVASQPIKLSTNFMTLIPSMTFTDFTNGFHGAFTTGVAWQQETQTVLTPGTVPL